MILNGNQRGGAKNLAQHLLKEENEHVELHELRGFASQNLTGALNEIYAISRGTKCQQFMYSLSLNPPAQEQVDTPTFEQVIEQAEQRLNLSDQPRAIIFHEKEGRRHCHVVWSRIKIEEMKAISMSHDRRKLTSLSRELYLENGWKMPHGLAKSEEKNPKNFTHEEWQQAKRAGKDPRAIKTAFQDAWAISDSKAAFSHALQERGYTLARGDRRGYVAVGVHGEVYSVPKQTGLKTKEVRARLGDAKELASVTETKQQIAGNMLPVMQRFKEEVAAKEQREQEAQKHRLKTLVEAQRKERQAFLEKQQAKQQREALERQARFRTGLKGLWDKLRGEHKRIQQENERHAAQSRERDRKAKDQFITMQLSQRRMLREQAKTTREQHQAQRQAIKQDETHYQHMRSNDTPAAREDFIKVRQTQNKERAARKQTQPRSNRHGLER